MEFLTSNICSRCGKEIDLPIIAHENAATYHNKVLVTSSCCGKAFYIIPIIKFSLCEYNGERTEDDWDNPIKKLNLK